MKDYYLLIGLNIKEIKILDVNQRGNVLIEVDIENRKKEYDCALKAYYLQPENPKILSKIQRSTAWLALTRIYGKV